MKSLEAFKVRGRKAGFNNPAGRRRDETSQVEDSALRTGGRFWINSSFPRNVACVQVAGAVFITDRPQRIAFGALDKMHHRSLLADGADLRE
ncbi:MAG: hypothetical protein QMC74_12550 [Myxococcota bacterium]|jgi:hypothetical protein